MPAEETIKECVREVRDHTGHDLEVRQHHLYEKRAFDHHGPGGKYNEIRMIELAEWRLLLICVECGAQWSMAFPAPMLQKTLASEIEYQHKLLALFLEPMATECFGVTDRQLMAEYVTRQLVAAGPRGLALNELIRELITNDLAPAGSVLRAMDALAFDVDDDRLVLPPDHPLRSW